MSQSIGNIGRLLLISSLIMAGLVGVIFNYTLETLRPFAPAQLNPVIGFAPAVAAAVAFVAVFLGGLIEAAIGGAWLYIWVYIFGGRKGIGQTVKSVAHGITPLALFGWLPFLLLATLPLSLLIAPDMVIIVMWVCIAFFTAWSMILTIIGVKQTHGISITRATTACIVGGIIAPLLLYLLLSYLLPSIFPRIIHF